MIEKYFCPCYETETTGKVCCKEHSNCIFYQTKVKKGVDDLMKKYPDTKQLFVGSKK